MNKKKEDLEQNQSNNIEQKPESVVQVSESQIETKRKAKLEQEQELRTERLNATGNDRLVREMQKNEIARVKPVKKRTKRTKTPPLRNEKGIKLNKDGTEDKRSANFYNGPLYKAILERKKMKEDEVIKKKVVYTPIVESDSESDVEFDIEVITPTPAPVQQNAGTNDYLKKQEEERQKQLLDAKRQLEVIEQENKKLKDDFHFNSHLNRISLSARSMKLKF